jgi:hypothetical protein
VKKLEKQDFFIRKLLKTRGAKKPVSIFSQLLLPWAIPQGEIGPDGPGQARVAHILTYMYAPGLRHQANLPITSGQLKKC